MEGSVGGRDGGGSWLPETSERFLYELEGKLADDDRTTGAIAFLEADR